MNINLPSWYTTGTPNNNIACLCRCVYASELSNKKDFRILNNELWWINGKGTFKFDQHHDFELIVKYNIGLKTLLQQGISEPIFHGDLVYKFKRIVGKSNFSDQFKKIVKRYIRVGYNLDIMRQSACLVLNPITVYSYGFLFNCMAVGQASDSMTALT